MNNKKRIICLIVFLYFQFPVYLFANSLINYNSYLVDLNGQPVNKTIKVKFSIFNNKNEIKWFRERYVTVVNGQLEVILGRTKPISFNVFDQNHYIGLSLKNNTDYEEMRVRQKLLKSINLSTQLFESNNKSNIDKNKLIKILNANKYFSCKMNNETKKTTVSLFNNSFNETKQKSNKMKRSKFHEDIEYKSLKLSNSLNDELDRIIMIYKTNSAKLTQN